MCVSVCVCAPNTIRAVCDMMKTNGLTDRGTHSGEGGWGVHEGKHGGHQKQVQS